MENDWLRDLRDPLLQPLSHGGKRKMWAPGPSLALRWHLAYDECAGQHGNIAWLAL